MSSATVTSKGQVTIPVDVRQKLGLRAGSRLSFVQTDTGSYEIHLEAGSVRDLKGAVSQPRHPVTLSDMDAAIADGASSAPSS